MHQLNLWGRGRRTKPACLRRLRLIPPPRRGGLGVPGGRGCSWGWWAALGLQGWKSPSIAQRWSAGAVPAAQGYRLGGEDPLACVQGPHSLPEPGRGLQRCFPSTRSRSRLQVPLGGMGAQLSPSRNSGPAVGLLLQEKSPSGGTSMPGPPELLPSPKERVDHACPASGAAITLAAAPAQGSPGDPTREHRPLFSSLLVSFLERGCSLPGAHAPQCVSP